MFKEIIFYISLTATLRIHAIKMHKKFSSAYFLADLFFTLFHLLFANLTMLWSEKTHAYRNCNQTIAKFSFERFLCIFIRSFASIRNFNCEKNNNRRESKRFSILYYSSYRVIEKKCNIFNDFLIDYQ